YDDYEINTGIFNLFGQHILYFLPYLNQASTFDWLFLIQVFAAFLADLPSSISSITSPMSSLVHLKFFRTLYASGLSCFKSLRVIVFNDSVLPNDCFGSFKYFKSYFWNIQCGSHPVTTISCFALIALPKATLIAPDDEGVTCQP